MAKPVTLGPYTIKGKDAERIRKDVRKKKLRREAKKYPTQPGVQKYLPKPKPKKKLTGEQKLGKVITGERRLATQKELAARTKVLRARGSNRTPDLTKDQRKELAKLRLVARQADTRSKLHKIGDEALKGIRVAKDVGEVGNVPLQLGKIGAGAVSGGAKGVAKPRGQKVLVAGYSGSLRGAKEAALDATSSAAHMIDYTARPSYAISAGTEAALRGKNVVKAAGRGISGKDRRGFTKVVKTLGVKDKTTANVLGFVGDVLLDPVTYVTFGTATVPKAIAQSAAKKAAAEAAKKGLQGAERETFIKAAVKTAVKEHAKKGGTKARGVQVGARVNVPLTRISKSVSTKGKLTAKASKARPLDLNRRGRTLGERAEKVRSSRPISFFNETFIAEARPKAFTKHTSDTVDEARRANDVIQSAAARARSRISHGETAASQIKMAAKRAGLSADDLHLKESLTAAEARAGKGGPRVKRYQEIVDEDLNIQREAGVEVKEFDPGAMTIPQRKRLADAARRDRLGKQRLVRQARIKFKVEKEKGKVMERGSVQVPESVIQRQREAVKQAALTLRQVREMDVSVPAREGETTEQWLTRIMEKGGRRGKEAERILAENSKDAKSYVAHVQRKTLDDLERERVATGYPPQQQAKPKAQKHRGIRKRLIDLPTRDLPTDFSDDAAELAAHGRRKAESNAGLAEMWGTLKRELARPITPDKPIELREGEAIYRAEKGNESNLILVTNWTKPGEVNAINARMEKTGVAPARTFIMKEDHYEAAKQAVVSQKAANSRAGQALDKTYGILKKTLIRTPSKYMRDIYGNVEFGWKADVPQVATANAARKVGHGKKVLEKARSSTKQFEEGTIYTEDVRKALDAPVEYGGFKTTVGDAFKRMERSGSIDTGYTGGEVVSQGGRPRWKWSEETERFLRGVENFGRIQGWLEGKARGMTDDEASTFTRRSYIDYEHRTEAEKAIRRWAIPFWTFLAGNARIQVRTLFTRPGKFATTAKALNLAARELGYTDYIDYFDSLPPHLQTGLTIPVKINGKVTGLDPSLPASTGFDPVLPNKTLKTLTSSVGPVQKFPFEYKTNELLFTEQQIRKEDRYRPGAFVHNGYVKAPAWAVKAGLTKKIHDKEGKFLFDGWDGRVSYVANIIPQMRAFSNTMTPSKPSTAAQASQFGLGLKVTPAADAKARKATLYAQQKAVNKRLGELEAEGKAKTPEYAQLKATQKWLNKTLDTKKKPTGASGGYGGGYGSGYGGGYGGGY